MLTGSSVASSHTSPLDGASSRGRACRPAAATAASNAAAASCTTTVTASAAAATVGGRRVRGRESRSRPPGRADGAALALG